MKTHKDFEVWKISLSVRSSVPVLKLIKNNKLGNSCLIS